MIFSSLVLWALTLRAQDDCDGFYQEETLRRFDGYYKEVNKPIG